MIRSINPATDEVIKEYSPQSGSAVDLLLEKVHMAQVSWEEKTFAERSQTIKRVGEILRAKKEALAKVCTEEMGKVYVEAIAEVEKCALACDYYAENAESFLQDEALVSDGQESFITYRPLGIILGIMPWNFPFWQVIRFAIPTLCAGNGVVLKHASNVFGCALALEDVLQEAGLPKDLFRTLLIPSQDVNRVIAHPLVKAVSLTGSTQAGKEVAKKAGEVLKKCVLELGGSDAYLVLRDAHLEEAARILVKGRMLNVGQSCISPKRIIVVKEVMETFTQIVLKEMRQIKQEDLGPMARKDLREDLHQQVQRSLEAGAQCLLGGKKPEGRGSFYPATLLTRIKPGMAAFDEEMFGPVMCLIEADDEAKAIELANQSVYGLGGGIFSKDLKRAKKIASQKLHTGGVFINEFLRSDPRLPFGGIKESGYGRELSYLGIREFVNVKTIFMK